MQEQAGALFRWATLAMWYVARDESCLLEVYLLHSLGHISPSHRHLQLLSQLLRLLLCDLTPRPLAPAHPRFPPTHAQLARNRTFGSINRVHTTKGLLQM